MELARRIPVAIAIVMAVPACSAIVDPDGTKLGGPQDAGIGSDGGDSDVPPGDGGTCPEGCDDGIECTVDSCEGGSCAHEPDDGACGAEERCNPGVGCVPIRCTGDSDCNDRMFCNGEETCDPSSPDADPTTGCVPGDPPDCDDGVACTTDSCDESADECAHEADHSSCDDGVECTIDNCDPSSGCNNEADHSVCASGFCFTGGECDPDSGCVGGSERDCRDGDPCTMDSCSESMMMCVNEPRDDDGDGHATDEASGTPCSGDDCNDSDDSVHPGATEDCNGRDDDCDESVDEGCPSMPDTCDMAQEITLSGGSASISGSFGGFGHDYSTECGGEGPDAVYYVDISSNSDVTIDTLGSEVDTVLGASLDCGSFNFACDNDMVPGRNTASRIWAHNVRPDTGSTRFYILVDADSASASGSYTLNIDVSDPAPDSCSGPIDISGGGTLVGAIPLIGTGSYEGSCQGFTSGREVVAAFDRPADGDARFQAFSGDFTPDVYLREMCSVRGSEYACQQSSGGSVDMTVGVSSRSTVFLDGARAGDRYFLFYNP